MRYGVPKRTPPKRVLIIGCGGSGKSTLAQQIGKRTGLPVVHLDKHFWLPGWNAVQPGAWHRIVAGLVARPAWIMDGNYGGTMVHRLSKCDLVVFLDMPTITCLWRVLKRRVVFARRNRPDMAVGCREHLTWAFLHYIVLYRRTRRPKIMNLLGALDTHQSVVVLDKRSKVKEFLNNLAEVFGYGPSANN